MFGKKYLLNYDLFYQRMITTNYSFLNIRKLEQCVINVNKIMDSKPNIIEISRDNKHIYESD